MQTTLVSDLSEEKILELPQRTGHRILVLRTATRSFSAVLGKLRQEFPDSHITVMAPLSCHASLREDPMVDDILTAPDAGRWGLSNPGPNGISALKEGRFDLAVALYNEPQGQGYSNIDALAAATNAREVRGYSPDSNFAPITSTSIRRKYFKERTAWFWLIANAVTSVLLMGVVALALTSETLIRKLRGLWRPS